MAVVIALIAGTSQYSVTINCPNLAQISGSVTSPGGNNVSLASDSGSTIEVSPYLVIEMPNSSVPALGKAWSTILNSSGIVSHVLSTQDILAQPTLLQHAPAVLLDGSLGSGNGSGIPDTFIQLLISCDIPVILTGRAAWLLHSLRASPLASATASVSQRLLTAPGYETATFLNSPITLSISSQLTEETGLVLPVDMAQGEHSRIVNLTGVKNHADLAVLRYDSYPLDCFLFSPEDPTKLTDQGRGLLVNIIAFSVALRETSTTNVVSQLQAPYDSLFAGGYRYLHEPTLKAAYAVVHSAKSALSMSDWSTWKSQKQPLIQGLLDSLFVDYGSQAGFMNSVSENTVSVQTAAEGLWLASSMGLLARYGSDKLISYLASRQDAEGGFNNDLTTTCLVVEGLTLSASLAYVNTANAETWLRSCIIDGSKTSNPDLWGAVGQNPTTITARTSYAAQYVMALQLLGKNHGDPLKLTSWITTRMSNGDGSYKETLGSSGELVIGTSSALTAMAIMNTLSYQNLTTGMSWLAANQLPSGGFGLTEAASDNVGKTWPTMNVGQCIQAVGQQSESMASKVMSFLSLCETELGFEVMEKIPSLMWTSWLASISRLSHSAGFSDYSLAKSYVDGLVGWSQYPGNVTAATPIEYSPTQYRMQSAWTQYFGAAVYAALGSGIPDSAVSAGQLYVYQCQDPSGHYKPTAFMGAPQMQYTVAAVESLYLLNALDTVHYRTSLESAVLAEFESGQWSTEGWTLKPFASQQSAVDWLCTRTALRLGILDSAKAEQVQQSVTARIQYSDLWALSRDVATLALLNASGFSASLDCVDSQAILQSLGGTPFSDGWFNSTKLWQPIYAAGVLEMISILGLRTRLATPSSSSINATGPSVTEIGSSMVLAVSMTPLSGRHCVIVFAFECWRLFRYVSDTDSIQLSIPCDYKALGPSNIAIMLQDFSLTRAYCTVSIQVQGTLQGTLQIPASRLPRGHNVNGTIDWSLECGFAAGQTHVSIDLSNGLVHQQIEYTTQSPLSFSLPTSGLLAGLYSITAQLDKPYCQNLTLLRQVTLLEPVQTYISALALIQGKINETLTIGWSLHYLANGSDIPSQRVKITVRDQSGAIALERSGTISPFTWAPSQRGNYSFILFFAGNDSLESASFAGAIHVYESTKLQWIGAQVQNQYSSGSYDVRLSTESGIPLSNYPIHIIVTSPSSAVIVNTQMVTNATGFARLSFILDDNGVYLLNASISDIGFLIGCSASQGLISWSASSLVVGGTTSESLVGTTWNLWTEITDSSSMPVSGVQVTLRIVYLPSTIIAQQTLTTDSTGRVVFQWAGNTAGTYRFEAEFGGTLSRGNSLCTAVFELRVPVVVLITAGENPLVGEEDWLEILALDYRGIPISGLTASVLVRGPTNQTVYQTTVTTQNQTVHVAWLPGHRGINSIVVCIDRQYWYERVEKTVSVAVMETPVISADIAAAPVAPCSISLELTVKGHDQSRLAGVEVIVVAIIDDEVILDSSNLTSSVGEINLILQLPCSGTLNVNITCPSQGWLVGAWVLCERTVLGMTSISLTSPAQPVKQGSLVGLVATLTDYNGYPIIGAQVDIVIGWASGTVCSSSTTITGAGGKCSIAYIFNTVGDFVITASFGGSGLQAPSNHSEPQRIFVVPGIVVIHDASYLIGQDSEVDLGLKDALGNNIAGRTLLLRIDSGSNTLFQSQVQTIDGLVRIHWTPTNRGQILIRVLHAGDVYYYTNSTVSCVPVMEVATGSLLLSAKQTDVLGIVALQYSLTAQGNVNGVTVHFEVLGVNLVPVWTAEAKTNSSGFVQIIYVAQQAYGILMVVAEPAADECLLGAGTQKQLVVMTEAQLSATFGPIPPCAINEVTVSMQVQDELGALIDGISVIVRVYDPYGQQVKLGPMSSSITLQVRNGTAGFAFTPQYPGLYTLDVSSSGSVIVHPFQTTTLHTVYSRTSLVVFVQSPCMEVGAYLNVTVLLSDSDGLPMDGRTISLQLDGPGSRLKGPVDVVTNATGYSTWRVQMDEIGLWKLRADFAGIGVYLATTASVELDVRYATNLDASLTTTAEIVAGRSLAQLRMLLSDSGGTPLEGFSVQYDVYHEIIGLCLEGNIIQLGQSPVLLNLTLPLAGNYTVILSFAGTEHYLPSSAAVSIWARGTTTIVFQCPARTDRSEDGRLVLTVVDESCTEMAIEELDLQIELTGPNGLIALAGLVHINGSRLIIPLRGFAVGDYEITATVPDSVMRLGGSSWLDFVVSTTSALVIPEKALPGVPSRQHYMIFLLTDSLGDATSGMTVFVSLYDPRGREIYGSPLTTRTPVVSTLGGTRVEWTPSEIGNYTLILVFDGDALRTGASIEIVVLIRYECTLGLDIPRQIVYGQALSLSVTLSGPVSKIQEAQIVVIVTLGGVEERHLSIVTDIRGSATLSIEGLGAGNHSVFVVYEGSPTYNVCAKTVSLTVSPIVSMKATANSDAVVGISCIVTIEYEVAGLSSEWKGTLTIDARGPENTLVGQWAFSVTRSGLQQVVFIPEKEGTYLLNVTLSGLPVLASERKTFTLPVRQSIPIQLDESTIPVVSEIGIIAGVALFLSRKLKKMESLLPGEWEP